MKSPMSGSIPWLDWHGLRWRDWCWSPPLCPPAALERSSSRERAPRGGEQPGSPHASISIHGHVSAFSKQATLINQYRRRSIVKTWRLFAFVKSITQYFDLHPAFSPTLTIGCHGHNINYTREPDLDAVECLRDDVTRCKGRREGGPTQSDRLSPSRSVSVAMAMSHKVCPHLPSDPVLSARCIFDTVPTDSFSMQTKE